MGAPGNVKLWVPPHQRWGNSPSGLGKGFLTGKIDEKTEFDKTDFRNVVPRFTPEARKANQSVVEVVREMAERKKVTPAQIALAWVLAQKSWIVPIPGTTKLHRLTENIASVKVELSPSELRELTEATSKIKIEGARYPKQLENRVNR